MTNRRIKLLNKLIGSATGEDEAVPLAVLWKLSRKRSAPVAPAFLGKSEGAASIDMP